MSKKKVVVPNVEKLDFGFGLVDPETSNFETLARGIGLDPTELAKFLKEKEHKQSSS